MGIEFFLLIVILILGVAAFLFFSGSFGVAKLGSGKADGDERPRHAYVEDPTDAKLFRADSSDEVRARAQEDPGTEVRT